MGRKCRVEGCLSDSRRPEDLGVTFHKVPFHADIRPKWLSLCRIPSENQANKIIYVCSRHFRRNDFCTFKGTKYMLKQGVLPSMFPWTNEIARQAPKLEPATKPTTEESETKKSEDSSEPPVLSEIESDSQEKTSDETSKESTDMITRRSKKRSIDTKETTKVIETPKSSESRTMEDDIKKLEEAYFSDSKDSSSQDEYIPLSDFTQGARVEVTDFSGSWFPAKIIEIDYTENEVFIEFEDSTKSNEWIPMDSKRLRQYADIEKPVQFEVAERVMAMWKNSIKFPATIQKVLANDTYEVLFDDNISLVLKASKISKANQSLKKMTPVTPKSHPSPLFAPVEGSKQDRRDRKRKLNVAELFNKKRPKSDTHSPSSVDKLTKDGGGTSGSDGEKDVDMKDNKTSDSVKNEAGNTSMSNESGIISPTSGEWICRWLNGEPVGKRSLVDTRRSVIVDDPKIPPGWVKHFVCRAQGSSAGKWDTVVISPEGKKFRSKSDLQAYLEKEKLPYTLENFDFSLHLKKARSLGLYEINENIKRPVLKNPVIPPPKPKTTPKTETVKETKSSTPAEKDNTAADEASNSSLKIIFENGAYKCPIEGCAKTFRKENLTQMHVKHYHPEYSKFIGSTPNVADLAYARTVGEPIEDFLPKTRTVQTPLLSPNSEKLKTETPPPKTVRTSIPNKTPLSAIENEKSSEIEKGAEIILSTPARSKEKESEIVKILNSDTKTAKSQEVFKMESKLVKINNNLLSPKYEKKNSPVHMTEAKVVLEKRDIPRPSEIKDHKQGPDSKPSGGGIKTLLPVIRTPQDPDKKHTPTPPEPPLTPAIENISKTNITPKTGPGKHFKRRRNNSEQEPYRKRKYTRHQDYDYFPDYHDAGSRSPDYVPYGRKRKTVDFVDSPTVNEYSAYQQTPPPKHIVTDTGEVIKIVTMKQEEIINCTCGFMEEDGLMIQCELCLCWQHAYCNNIEREDQVPEKYICYICQNPLRMRASRKYMHDQDWLKHGVLPTASFHAKDDAVLNARYERLRQSHELSGNLRELSSVMHSLRVKLKIAENKDHPKFYLWSKPWPKLEVDNNVQEILDNQTRIENKEDNNTTFIEDTIKTEVPISPNEIENSLNRLLNPTEEESSTNQNKPLSFDTQLEEPNNTIKNENPPPQTNSELLNILEGNTEPIAPAEPVKSEEQESTSEQTQQLSASLSPKKDLNETEMKTKNWIDGGAMSGEVSDGEMISQALASEALANDLLSSPTSLNLALSQSDIEKIQNTIDNSAGALVNPCVPEPEAKIEPDICRENLIDNISHYQKLINSRMDSIEEQISKLENEDPGPSLTNTNETTSDQQIDQKMKETFIMMLRDLSKIRKLAALY